MVYSDEVERLLHLFWSRDSRLKNLRRLNAPLAIVEHTRYLVESLRKKLHLMGLDEVELQIALNERLLEYEQESLEGFRMEHCIHSIRHNQQCIQKDDIVPLDCKQRGQSCYDCPDYQKTTEKQQSDFMHGYDVDTGEKLPKPPGLIALEKELNEDSEEK